MSEMCDSRAYVRCGAKFSTCQSRAAPVLKLNTKEKKMMFTILHHANDTGYEDAHSMLHTTSGLSSDEDMRTMEAPESEV